MSVYYVLSVWWVVPAPAEMITTMKVVTGVLILSNMMHLTSTTLRGNPLFGRAENKIINDKLTGEK